MGALPRAVPGQPAEEEPAAQARAGGVRSAWGSRPGTAGPGPGPGPEPEPEPEPEARGGRGGPPSPAPALPAEPEPLQPAPAPEVPPEEPQPLTQLQPEPPEEPPEELLPPPSPQRDSGEQAAAAKAAEAEAASAAALRDLQQRAAGKVREAWGGVLEEDGVEAVQRAEEQRRGATGKLYGRLYGWTDASFTRRHSPRSPVPLAVKLTLALHLLAHLSALTWSALQQAKLGEIPAGAPLPPLLP